MKRGNKVAPPARDAAEPVSELTTNRLSVYLRCLNALDASNVRSVSSQALAEQFNLNAAQIRKDLAHFGEFGVRGVGYYVKDLRRHLRQILGLDRRVRVAIMGAGNLGLALADYAGFRDEGFEIAALFDTVRDKIGQRSRSGVPIHDSRDLKRVVRRERIAIAVIAVPVGRCPGGGQHGRCSRHEGSAELLARCAHRAARREAQERRPDGLAREPVVLPRAVGGGTVTARRKRASAPRLSHVDAGGQVRMVDVTGKAVTAREATAHGRIRMSAEALEQIRSGVNRKGDPLQTARLAGIMAAKQTAALIPLCHPLPLSHVEVVLHARDDGYEIVGTARTTAQTGVEMEALTAVAVAALTIYDMVKAVDKAMVIDGIELLEKRGGKSGAYRKRNEQ